MWSPARSAAGKRALALASRPLPLHFFLGLVSLEKPSYVLQKHHGGGAAELRAAVACASDALAGGAATVSGRAGGQLRVPSAAAGAAARAGRRTLSRQAAPRRRGRLAHSAAAAKLLSEGRAPEGRGAWPAGAAPSGPRRLLHHLERQLRRLGARSPAALQHARGPQDQGRRAAVAALVAVDVVDIAGVDGLLPALPTPLRAQRGLHGLFRNAAERLSGVGQRRQPRRFRGRRAASQPAGHRPKLPADGVPRRAARGGVASGRPAGGKARSCAGAEHVRVHAAALRRQGGSARGAGLCSGR
eukprot:scaffold40_cov305-Pinguiococcus_pyrenoidosus.AAC.33